jgi:hypothetical protein
VSRRDITDQQVVKAYTEARGSGVWPYELLHQWTGQPLKVCLRAVERASERGLIEYGVSLRAGWLTEAGEELLKAESKGPHGK